MLRPVLLPPITVPTGRIQRITEVRAAAAPPEVIVHLQLLPNQEVLTVLHREVTTAAEVTAAVAHRRQGAIPRVVRAVPAAAGHPHHHHHHQEEEDNPGVSHNF